MDYLVWIFMKESSLVTTLHYYSCLVWYDSVLQLQCLLLMSILKHAYKVWEEKDDTLISFSLSYRKVLLFFSLNLRVKLSGHS